ncbi:MAG: aminoglycoside 6-adenylyltransferase [Chloroflexota bacterium]
MFEQDRVIVRLQQYLMRDESVAACFLSGSFGRRTADEYSDLDVALVFTGESRREAAWSRRRQIVEEAMPYVPAKSFDADHVRPFFHIALYSNGAKVDYRFETQADLPPNFWDKDIRILKDTADKWAEQYQATCQQAPLVQPRLSSAELKALDDRFWVMFMDVFRLLLRDDSDKPFTIYLELLHFTLPPLLHVLPPEDPSRAPLQQAYFGKDTAVTRQHLAHLLDAYMAARTAVIRRLSLSFTINTAFENQVQQLVKKKTE